jgi:hypothetical protein
VLGCESQLSGLLSGNSMAGNRLSDTFPVFELRNRAQRVSLVLTRIGFTATVLAGFGMYLLGARDYVLVFGTLIALFPITWFVFVLTAAVMPPKIGTSSSSLLDRHERQQDP